MTNQTTTDNNQSADSRATPQVAREYTVSLSASTSAAALKHDVKSCVVKPSGADITAWVSYNDGSNDTLAGLQVDNANGPGYSIQASPTAAKIVSSEANATAEKTLITIPDGVSFQIAQNGEFNKVNVKSAGTCTVYVWPGGGLPNGVN